MRGNNNDDDDDDDDRTHPVQTYLSFASSEPLGAEESSLALFVAFADAQEHAILKVPMDGCDMQFAWDHQREGELGDAAFVDWFEKTVDEIINRKDDDGSDAPDSSTDKESGRARQESRD